MGAWARTGLVIRGFVGLCALALVLVGSGCGGDDNNQSAASNEGASTTPSTPAEQQPAATTEQPATGETVPAPTDTTSPGTSPDQSGGAGGAEPARTLAQFTGKGGRITPRLIRVPPGIPIRAELRSVDGKRYVVDFGDGHRLTTGGNVASASTMLEPLISQAQRVARPIGGDYGSINIRATVDPGP